MLACCRPTLFERRASWCAERVHRRIDLQPLGKDMSRLLVSELLKKLPEVPAALRELVTGGAEGNPFYMEELVKMLIDQGAIEAGEVWKVNAERLLLTKVPTTLTGVLQARLDGLPAPERLTLQQASVIGPVFWDRALVALDTKAHDSLPALVRRELALPRADSKHDDLREYAFKHQILHQVTYATVLKRTRRELHGKLARWLAAQTGLRANDFLGEAARHFELAGDEANAAEYHTRAAEHARTRLAHEAVLDHVQQALALLERTPGAGTRLLRWRLLEVREATLDIQGDRVGQRADIDAMAELAEALDDDRRRAHAAWRRSALAQRLADYAATEAAARQAVEWARRAGDDEIRLLAQRMLAMALAFQGRPAEGRVVAEEALAEARALALRRVEGLCLNALGVMLAMQSDDVGALQLDQQSLAAHRAAGDRRNEAIAQGNIGAGWLGLGELTRARRDLEEGLRLLRVNGERALEVSPLCALSTLALWQGDDAHALVQARAALETAVAVHARDQEAAALCRVGDAELALGRHAPAAEAFASAHARASEIASPYRHDASAGLARVALAQGDTGGGDAGAGAVAGARREDRRRRQPARRRGVPAPRRVDLSPGAGERGRSRRPPRRRVAGPRARGASGPGGNHHRRRASPGLPVQHPGSPRDRGGVRRSSQPGSMTRTAARRCQARSSPLTAIFGLRNPIAIHALRSLTKNETVCRERSERRPGARCRREGPSSWSASRAPEACPRATDSRRGSASGRSGTRRRRACCNRWRRLGESSIRA